MVRRLGRRVALVLFAVYLALLPGSTLLVALDRVPAWGLWMGGALLMLQGAAALSWLLGLYGGRGALAGVLLFLLGWGVEALGVRTGLPFGRYRYTAALQPQLLGQVPLAIGCAWLMVALGAWQLAGRYAPAGPRRLLCAGTLVLLLDLQIEPVATAVNQYWVWIDSGRYYGVPLANFVAWWWVGMLMALLLARLLPADVLPQDTRPRLADRLLLALPIGLYALSALMFACVNLARGYGLAGLFGLALLVVVALPWLARGARLRAAG